MTGKSPGFRSALARYGAAILAVILAALVTQSLAGPFAGRPFVPFFLSIFLVVIFIGPGPGIVATMLSAAIVTYYFTEPIGSLYIALHDDRVRLLAFVLLGLIMSLGAELMRRKREVEAARSREAAAEELRRSEEEYRTLFEASRDGIALVNLEGRFLQANKAFQDMVGYSLDELRGLTRRQITPPKWREMEEAIITERVLRLGDSGEYEKEYIRKDGRIFPISIRTWPALDKYGEVVGMRAFIRDITDRKRAEDALKEADKRKDHFLATLAHELRNPLAAIRSATYALRDEASKETKAKRELVALAIIDRQLNHLIRLVDDLLEASRITTGNIELKRARVDLIEALRDAVEVVQPAIDRSGHVFKMDAPMDPLLVDGDAVRLTQIFANLLNNAVKYTEDGGVVSLAVERRGNEATVTVRDNGIGIPQEAMPHIFDLFTQVDRRGANMNGGLGIGLGLVKNLVERHGGTVEAQSDGPGRGSMFTVRLPLADGRAPSHQ
ncbi:MAG TPA: PAS domain S-box protein [Methylocystis sp.]|jgi:PAS domain S-box-containing protein